MIPEDKIKNNVYYFIIQEGKNIKPIKELSNNDYEEIQKAKMNLVDLRYYRRRMKEIEQNHTDYITNCIVIEKELATNPLKDLKEFDKYFIDINRRFINFITSFKSFTDSLEGRIKGRYGETSIEFESLKKILSNKYDTYFSYRFFYHLRNFAVHFDYPIHNIMMDYEYNPNKSIKKAKLNVNFVKSHLLSNSRLKSKFQRELKSYADKFPVKPYMDQILQPISKFYIEIVKIEEQFFKDAIQVFEKYINQIETNGEYGYSQRLPISPTLFKWDSKYFPIDLITEFNELIKVK